MFKKYIEYFKDNPEGYWFKKKLYGWGWTPVKWQGWLAVLLFVAFIIWSGIKLSSVPEPTDSMITWHLVRVVFSIIALIVICYIKGEKPGWQWGIKDKNKDGQI